MDVRQGRVIAPSAFTSGELGAKNLINAIRGMQVPYSTNLQDQSPIGPLATKATLAADPSFTAQWDG